MPEKTPGDYTIESGRYKQIEYRVNRLANGQPEADDTEQIRRDVVFLLGEVRDLTNALNDANERYGELKRRVRAATDN